MIDLLMTFALMVVAVVVVIGLLKLLGKGTKIAAKAAATPWGSVLIIAGVAAALSVVMSDLGMLWVLLGLVAIGVVIVRARTKAAPWELHDDPWPVARIVPPAERHPDADLVDRIRAEWPQACMRAGLVAGDANSTVAWRDANRTDSSGHWLDDTISIVSKGLARKTVANTAGVIVDGTGVYRHPILLGARPADIGPVFTVQGGQFSLDDFGRRAVALASNLRVPELNFVQTKEHIQNGVLDIEVVVRDPLGGVRQSLDQRGRGTEPITIGRSRPGDVFWDPFASAHCAIQGKTRSGKSALVYGMVSALVDRPEVLVTGVDPSRVLLSPWKDRPGSELRSIGEDLDGAVKVFDGLVAEMVARLEQLDAEGVDKFDEFTPERPLIVAVLEEFAGLADACSVADKALKPAERLRPRVEAAKDRLLREGAKVGIRVLMIAQRFDADLVGGSARAQFGLRITLCVDNLDGVRMLHEHLSAEDAAEVFTYPPGRALVQAPGMPVRVMQADLTEYQTYRQRVMGEPRTTLYLEKNDG